MTVKQLQAVLDEFVKSNIGYNQARRWSWIDRLRKKIIPGRASDCSTSTVGTAWLGGLTGVEPPPSNIYTGNEESYLVARGWDSYPYNGDVNGRASDILVTAGHHTVIYRTSDKVLSAEFDERGKSTGGKDGNQNGRETRYRAAYNRPGGWRRRLRYRSLTTWKGRTLARYALGQSTKQALKVLKYRTPWDGPRWAWFIAQLAAMDKGMKFAYDVDKLTVPSSGHVFVLLGAGLRADGTLTAKGIRRARLAALAMDVYPNSRLIISGGKAKNGITEAEAMMTWIINQVTVPFATGVEAKIATDGAKAALGARITMEEHSDDTVQNAKNTLPLLVEGKFSSYTLISDVSHLRRASELFTAARLVWETAHNAVLGFEPTVPLAFNDYGKYTIKPEKPVDPGDRREIGRQIAAVFGLTSHYDLLVK